MSENEKVTMNSRVARSEEVLTSEVDGEVVMMSVEQGTYSGLDKIGSEIWRLLEKPMRIADICSTMTVRFDVTKADCEKDVLAFLNDLASDNTIQLVDETTDALDADIEPEISDSHEP